MNMRMVSIVATVLLCCAASAVMADDAAIKKVAKEKVEILNDAVIKGEYGKAIDLTHPKIVEGLGGREKMIAQMEKSIAEIKKQGFDFKSVKVGDASEVVKQGEELYLYVPYELSMTTPKGKLRTTTYVVGLSTDQGRSWTFVDGAAGETLKTILPNLPASLKLPEKKPPVLDKD